MVEKHSRIRSLLSSLVAAPLVRHNHRRITGGWPVSVPFWLWRVAPDGANKWVRRRVLDFAQTRAWKLLRSHDVLGGLVCEEGNGWAISPSTALFLWRLLEERKPQRIIEFGSGISTQVFAAFAQQMDEENHPVHILSIDHERTWLEETRRRLGKTGADRFTTLVHAPLTQQRLLNQEVLAYTIPEKVLAEAAGPEGFALCFIDGPPGKVGRGGCLPLAAPYLAVGAEILLDDSCRPGEQAVLAEWHAAWKAELTRPRLLLADSHGVGRLRWLGSRKSESTRIVTR